MMLRVLTVLACLVATSTALLARDPQMAGKTSEGKEFWVCFMKNFRDDAPANGNRTDARKLQLFLTSSHDATARIEVEGLRYDTTITIRANTVVTVAMPRNVQLRAVGVPERLAVHVTADTAISVYGLNSKFQTTDTYMGLPVNTLGTEYRVMGYTKLAADLLSAFTIIATEDNTDVTITPRTAVRGNRPMNKPYTIKLRTGDAYTVEAEYDAISACDLTGSLVQANKTIAVFSGHTCAYVPSKVEACNHLIEQIPPTSSWGKHFYLGNLKERSKYTFRVLASEHETKVFEDTRLVAMLRAGEFYENLNVTRHVQVTADKPVLVAQFAQGFKNGDSVGDPMMILVSPTQQFLPEYRFATPINGDWHHYINVVAPTASIRDLRLDGRRLDSALFMVLGESRYSIAQVPVPFGSHVIRGSAPFGLYSYGFGFGRDAYDAYGNMAGQAFQELNKLVDSLPPLVDGRLQRDDYLLTVRDDRTMDRGIKSIKVMFADAIDATVPKIEAGVPQVNIKLRPSISGSTGRLVVRAEDVAGNRTDFTVCYMFDAQSERFQYVISEGIDALCAADHAWTAGAYLMGVHTFHDANFSTSGNLRTTGVFTSDQGFALGIGGLVGRRLSQDFAVNARLQLWWAGGTLLSPDSAGATVFDPNQGGFVPYQEGTTVSISAPFLSLGVMAEWYPLRYFYVTGGIESALALGSSVTTTRRILQPASWTFADGTTEQAAEPTSLESLQSMNLALVGGLGFSYPITFRMSVFAEGMFTRWLGSMISDGTWRTQSMGINAGVRYRW
jgi:IgGFc binding protein